MERRLIARWQKGDRRAFCRLFDHHRGYAYRIALRMTGAPQPAEDVEQQSWMKAIQAIESFDGRSRFKTWLTRIVVNTAIDRRRNTQRHPGPEPLREGLDPGMCGLTFDTAHAARGGMADFSRHNSHFADHICAVDLKDMSREGRFCPLGEGVLGVQEALHSLERIGYEGWRCSPAAGARRSIDNWTGGWEDRRVPHNPSKGPAEWQSRQPTSPAKARG